MNSLKEFIARIADGGTLDAAETEKGFSILMSEEATPAQIGGFLMALRVRGETEEEFVGAVKAMRAKMLPVDAPDDAIDIVGTGGDAKGSLNVSTATALVASFQAVSSSSLGTASTRGMIASGRLVPYRAWIGKDDKRLQAIEDKLPEKWRRIWTIGEHTMGGCPSCVPPCESAPSTRPARRTRCR